MTDVFKIFDIGRMQRYETLKYYFRDNVPALDKNRCDLVLTVVDRLRKKQKLDIGEYGVVLTAPQKKGGISTIAVMKREAAEEIYEQALQQALSPASKAKKPRTRIPYQPKAT